MTFVGLDQVSEFSEESFGATLDYLHSGTCEINASNLPGVLCLASILSLPPLEKLCLKLAPQLLRDAPSVILMLAASEIYYRRHPLAKQLFDDVIAPFILETGGEILSEASISSLGQESMRRLYSLDLAVDDTTRFRAAALWAEAESHRQMTAVERGTRSTSEVFSTLPQDGESVVVNATPGQSADSMVHAESALAECTRESLRKQLIAPLVRNVSLRNISAADLMKVRLQVVCLIHHGLLFGFVCIDFVHDTHLLLLDI